MPFLNEFTAAMRGDLPTQQAGYLSAGRIGLDQPVHAMTFSPDGEWLAFGGDQGPEVRKVRGGRPAAMPPFAPEIYGAITAVHWVSRVGQKQDFVIFGTHRGFIIVWGCPEPGRFHELATKRLNGGFEVLCLATTVDGSAVRGLVGTYDKTIAGFKCTDDSVEVSFAAQLSNTIPRSVVFTDNHRDFRVFGMHDSCIHVISGDGKRILKSIKLDCEFIASASTDGAQRLLLVDHTEGFSAYHLRSGERFARYVTGEAPTGLPYQAAFGEGSQIVVTGGAEGKAFIFAAKGGSPVGVLRHSNGGRVQEISTITRGDKYLIACASSSDEVRPSISIWCRVKAAKPSQPRAPQPPAVPSIVHMAAVDSGNQLIATVVNAIVTLVGWTIKIMLLIILGMIIRGVWSALTSRGITPEGLAVAVWAWWDQCGRPNLRHWLRAILSSLE